MGLGSFRFRENAARVAGGDARLRLTMAPNRPGSRPGRPERGRESGKAAVCRRGAGAAQRGVLLSIFAQSTLSPQPPGVASFPIAGPPWAPVGPDHRLSSRVKRGAQGKGFYCLKHEITQKPAWHAVGTE